MGGHAEAGNTVGTRAMSGMSSQSEVDAHSR